MTELNETLVTLTADIVSAHVSNNSVAVNDLPTLIANVHGALTGLGREAEPTATKREPRVSIRSSVKPEAITCLMCGAKQKMLKRHLMTNHQMTPREYRDEFGLNADYPMVAPDYSEARRGLAVRSGLGRKPGQKAGTAKPAGAKPTRGARRKPGSEAPPSA